MATATCHIPQYVPKLEPSWDWVDRGRIHGLDGLRAISIVMVLLAHSSGWLMGSDSFISSLASLGSRGVDVFFVISGFLITLLLIRERNRTGTIFLRGFYTRRVLRIVPAYVIFLARTVRLRPMPLAVSCYCRRV